jgi:hypothetical protein
MQTNYEINNPVARRGMLADTGLDKFVISRLVELAAGIPAGVMCTRDGATDEETQCLLPTAAADLTDDHVLGISLYDASREPGTNADSNEYDDEDDIPLLRRGRAWVIAENDVVVAAGAQCYVRYGTGTGTQLGAFRMDGDTSTAAAISNCRFVTAATVVNINGEDQTVALVEINHPSA